MNFFDTDNSLFEKKLKRAATKPFVKWAGGKGQLLPVLRKFYPTNETKFTKYAEPFVGGGAVLFDILSTRRFKEIYISDINARLINVYTTVRDDAASLIKLLTRYQTAYFSLKEQERAAYFYDNRDKYNGLPDGQSLEKAALFIFLNKTCFNGLHRVNKSGKFNVPAGRYKNPTICDSENLINASVLLQQVKIVCADYKKSADFIDEQTFAYFDPPYRPLSQTASFTAYAESSFDDEKQKELALFVKKMSDKGAKILVSNSDPKNENPNDCFFETLYQGFQIENVAAPRMINSDPSARGKISELLIHN